MATIKKVVALSGEEYQRLKNKAAAYDAIMAEQTVETGTVTTGETTEESGVAAAVENE